MAREVQRKRQTAQPVQSAGSNWTRPRKRGVTFGPRGEEQGLIAAPQILPQHGENVHDRNLMKSADEMARTAKMSVHCQ